MSKNALPLVISAPEPRTLELIFTPPQLARFRKKYRIVETTPEMVARLPSDILAEARYIV
ncbi:MAG: hydroxyacid dehydrogenase, partial [Mesorhizobium sp.]